MEEIKNELRRNKLYYSCRDPWNPRHRCLDKGHIITFKWYHIKTWSQRMNLMYLNFFIIQLKEYEILS